MSRPRATLPRSGRADRPPPTRRRGWRSLRPRCPGERLRTGSSRVGRLAPGRWRSPEPVDTGPRRLAGSAAAGATGPGLARSSNRPMAGWRHHRLAASGHRRVRAPRDRQLSPLRPNWPRRVGRTPARANGRRPGRARGAASRVTRSSHRVRRRHRRDAVARRPCWRPLVALAGARHRGRGQRVRRGPAGARRRRRSRHGNAGARGHRRSHRVLRSLTRPIRPLRRRRQRHDQQRSSRRHPTSRRRSRARCCTSGTATSGR